MGLGPMDLRALRLWHWRKVLSARRAANENREHIRRLAEEGRGSIYTARVAKSNDRLANFHLGAVQALNDVVSGTAEDDDQ